MSAFKHMGKRVLYHQRALRSQRTPQSLFGGPWGQEQKESLRGPLCLKSLTDTHAPVLSLLWSRNRSYPLPHYENTNLCPVRHSGTQEPGTPGKFSPTSSIIMTTETYQPLVSSLPNSPLPISCKPQGLSE